MTNQQLLELSEALSKVNNLKGSKFAYGIARNINLLLPEIKKYEENRKVLLESFAKKDKEGKPEIKDNQYILKDTVEFQKEFQKLLSEEVKIELFKINIKDVPEDISSEQMTGIFQIING